jgi:hypothetical protein
MVSSQVFAARHRFQTTPMVLIDGNAGDGVGAMLAQQGLFEPQLSETTPELLMRLAGQIGNATVILCEKNYHKRVQLQHRFPDATLLRDHAEVSDSIGCHYGYALWISDPCGYAHHGVEYMAQVANRVAKSDFVIAFNEGALNRLLHTARGGPWDKARGMYHAMMDPQWWMMQLNKDYLACSDVIYQSQNFQFRLMVVSNYIGSRPHRELRIIKRKRA